MNNPTYYYLPNLAAEIPNIPTDTIISRKLYEDERIKVILFGFAAGQELSEHTASQPAMIHILQGEVRLTLGNDLFEVGPGAWARMEAHLPHSVYAKTVTLMLLHLYQL
jgi:quercetin dioxygenase-like cupin family protein